MNPEEQGLKQEQALIDLWRQQGDQEAARKIVDHYIDRLLPLARRHLSQKLASRVDPEDIVQSVFRTFFGRLRQGKFVFAEQDDLCKLLMRITLHKTLRQVAFHTAAKRNPRQETEQGKHHHEQLMAVLDQEPTPEATITFLDQLEHLLTQLRPMERQIVELRMQGLSNEEVANQLGVYDRKVRRVLHQIRAMARQEGILDKEEAPQE
jgi:RNA polymerase sigma factor (sigma-70 family)